MNIAAGARLSTDDGNFKHLGCHGPQWRKPDPSQVVRLHLASAIQRVPEATAWALIHSLAQHGEDRKIVQNMAPICFEQRLGPTDARRSCRSFEVAGYHPSPNFRDWILLVCASQTDGLTCHKSIPPLSGEDLRRTLPAPNSLSEAGQINRCPRSWKRGTALYPLENRGSLASGTARRRFGMIRCFLNCENYWQ